VFGKNESLQVLLHFSVCLTIFPIGEKIYPTEWDNIGALTLYLDFLNLFLFLLRLFGGSSSQR
jgi:FtsH-binding integral membrane protein